MRSALFTLGRARTWILVISFHHYGVWNFILLPVSNSTFNARQVTS